VFVVAITKLASSIDSEVAALAPELGVTAYELRLTIAAGLPAVVLTTPDRDRAVALLGQIRARGQGAVACDDAAVVACDQMLAVRRFRFDPEAFCTEVAPSGEEQLPYDDVLALLRAVHKRSTETRNEVTEKKFAVGRAIASGGLLMRKSSTREVTSSSDGREQVLYIFRRSGQRPWVLSESDAKYAGRKLLEDDRAPQSAVPRRHVR
jgi:hypothetical protein